MDIKIFYDNGRIDEFDTISFTAGEPYPGTNMLTNFELRFDALDTESLWLNAHYYEVREDYREDEPPGEVPTARRKMGWRFLLVDWREISHVTRICVDDEDVAWRQAGYFVNGILFNEMLKRCCSVRESDSLNSKAVELHTYLNAANSDSPSDEDVLCHSFGFDAEAYRQVVHDESMQSKKTVKQDDEPDDLKNWIAEVRKERRR